MAELAVDRRADGLTVIRLTRPDTRNAVNPALSHLLRVAVQEAMQSAAAIAIEGEGTAFCAGGDISAHGDDSMALSVMDEMRETLSMLHRAPVPVAAFVNGPAVGGGAELAAAAHLLYAGPRARFAFVQRQMGLTPGWGGGVYLAGRVGRGRALDLLLSGRTLGWEEARSIGLVDVVLTDADWHTRYDRLTGWDRAYAEAAMAALQAEAAPEAQRRFAELWTSEPHRQAVRRFLESS